MLTDAGIHAVVKTTRDDDDDLSLDPRLRRVYVNAWPGKNRDAPAASHNWTLRRLYAVPVQELARFHFARSSRGTLTIPLVVRQRLDSVVTGLW